MAGGTQAAQGCFLPHADTCTEESAAAMAAGKRSGVLPPLCPCVYIPVCIGRCCAEARSG